MSASTTAKSWMKFPPQIKYIVGNEACERFSYYGMRSILFVFMSQYLLMEANFAKGVYHYFVSLGYLTPLLGGFIADRYLGKYRTIMILSIVYCIGHGVLAIWETKTALYWGLFLIALGMGGIKPCVSAHVGDQFTEKNKHLLAKVFDIFYWSINFGAFFSSLLIPWILPRFGPGWAFGIPGILMAIATWFFWLGRKHYVFVPPTGKDGPAGFLPVFWHGLKNWSKKKVGQSFMDTALSKYKKAEVEGAQAAWGIFKVFIGTTAFWALYDQQGSSWTEQALRMDLNVLGMQLEASQIQALNPILILIMIPIFSLWLYPLLGRLGWEMTPLRRMTLGMFIMSFSFAAMAIFQVLLDSGVKLNVSWQLLPYIILTGAEIMVSITGLEFAYTQAPRSLKSTIMGFWFFTIFAGNLFAGIVAQMNPFQGAGEFTFFGILMFVVSFFFWWGAKRYKPRSFMEA